MKKREKEKKTTNGRRLIGTCSQNPSELTASSHKISMFYIGFKQDPESHNIITMARTQSKTTWHTKKRGKLQLSWEKTINVT